METELLQGASRPGRSVDRSLPSVAKVNQDLYLFSPLSTFTAVYRVTSALTYLPKISIPNRKQTAFTPTAQCLTQICLIQHAVLYGSSLRHALSERYEPSVHTCV